MFWLELKRVKTFMEGGNTMVRCCYLDYKGSGFFGISNDRYGCKLCEQELRVEDPQVKFICNPEYGEKYKNSPVYQNNCFFRRRAAAFGSGPFFMKRSFSVS